MYKSNLHT